MESLSLLGVFGLGPTELIIVAIVALLLFGSRLPSVMRNLGKGYSEFHKGLRDVQKDLEG
jgi:sec-independent protein translocase protein TatA